MVKIVCDGETLTLSATDLELSYTASIPASFTNVTAFLVDATVLYKEVKALNDAVEDVGGNGQCRLHTDQQPCTLCISSPMNSLKSPP